MNAMPLRRALLAAALVALTLAGGARAAENAAITVVEMSGTPQEIGRQHGEQLGERIVALHEQYLNRYLATSAVRRAASLAAGGFEARLRPDHLAELYSMATTAGLDPRAALLAQCFLDLSPMVACSTFALPANASSDGVARFGRNLDFPSFNVADKHSVLMIYRPKDAFQFAVVGWPGMIGALSGMNEHGLALANMEVTRLPRLASAMPYTLLYRTVLEQCRTVGEAIELLEKLPRQSANNLMLMDAAGDRAVVEITPQSLAIRRGDAGAALISTNHQRGTDQHTPGRCRRYDALHEMSRSEFGRIDSDYARKMLQRVGFTSLTLQSMVFEPSNRVIHLSVGRDASRGQFQRIDLGEYFAKTATN